MSQGWKRKALKRNQHHRREQAKGYKFTMGNQRHWRVHWKWRKQMDEARWDRMRASR